MKIFIGLALLSVAFATEPFVLPEASQPAYEVNEPSQADDSRVLIAELVMFQTPDISPAFIEPALANMLNEFGEIPQEILNAQVDDVSVLFVDHADEVAPLNEAVKISPVQVADVLSEAQEAAVDSVPLENESGLVDSVLFVDAPLEEDSKSADVVDTVQEDAKAAEVVDPVLFVDAPLEDAKSADVADTVQEDAKTGEVVDPVLFVDAPLEEDAKVAAVVDTVQEDAKTADVVDSVLFVDAPLAEDAKSADIVDSVLVADVPLEDNASFADAPAPSALDQFIAKLLANRQEIISRDNPMLR